ncbi:T9SS-dependent choice-of-anchor J family protein [Flavobacterium sp.]|uniref:T9SS-dependent choice-of-anchor J family protein n=1 Tax=Flavobacterium sp. TaxID=239 RepID=UPI00286AF730|nr:choice-of-anchor J domain-containing protein [Flavobacterium sp.]
MNSKLHYCLVLLFFFFKGHSINTPFTVALKIDGTALVTIGSLSAGDTWQFEYGPSGFAEGTGTLSNFTGYYTISYKLDPFQTWDFRVRKKYLSFPTGEWSQVETLNNSCTSSPHYVGYTADFDTDPIQQCWRGYKSNIISTSVQINIENQNYDGNTGKSLLMYCGNAYTAMLVSPRLEDLASDKRIKFWLKGNGNSGQVKVGTITNPYDPTTFHELASYTGIGSTAFTQKTILFNDYNGTDKYIAFKLKVDFSAEACLIDQFSYEQSVNCIAAGNFNISNITEHSAQMDFDTSGQTNWELYVKNMLTTQVQTITINNANYVLNNLTGNTTYQVKLRANCGDGIYSPWTAMNSFTTPCENVVPGYYTGFDESAYFNPCWTKIATNSFYTINLAPSSASIMAASGTKYLSFDGTSDTTYKTILVSPYVPELDNNKRIRFKLYDNKRAYFLNYPFTVGTLSNPNDPTTFVPLVTLNPLDVNPVGLFELGSFWQQFILDFSNYSIPAGHHYIGFKIEPNAASFQQNIAFDDFYFDEIPQCKEPTNIQVISYDYDKATVSWNSASSATSWQIEYGPIGFVPGTGIIVDASSSPFTLANLTPDTNYDFYVRSVCAGGNSLLSSKGIFKTRCSGVTVGYSGGFENESFDPNATCWRRTVPILRNYSYSPRYFIDIYNNGQYGSYTAHTGTKFAKIFGGNDSPDTDEQNKTVLVTPRLIDLDNTKLLKFWAFCPNDAYSTLQQIVIGTLSNPDDYSTFTPFQTITGPYTLGQWKQYTADFSSYYGTDKYVGIKQISSNGRYILFIDDFEYTDNPCRKPTELMASQTAQTSATLLWNSNITVDGSTTWQLEYGELGFVPGTGTFLTVNTNPYVLSGLQSIKKYQFRVRNICANNATNWSDLYSFKITCSKTVPFYENFDQYNSISGGFVTMDPTICWTSNNTMYAGVVQYSMNNVSSAPNCAEVESSGLQNGVRTEGIMISPYLPDFDNTKQLKFWAYFPDGYSVDTMDLIVGTVKNPLDLSTFVPFQTFHMDGQAHSGMEYVVDFSSYTGDSKFFAFKSSGFTENTFVSNRIYIDDVYYESLPSCAEPLNIHTEFVNGNATHFLWQNTGTRNVTIEYGPEGFTQGSGTLLTSTTMDVIVSGLLPSSNYDFYFTTNCTNGNSITIGPKKITTTCLAESLPWYEDFNGLSNYGLNVLPQCFKDNAANDFHAYNTSLSTLGLGSGYDPDNLMTGYNDTTYLHFDDSFLSGIYTPVFHLTAGVSYKFSLQARKDYEYDFATLKASAVRGQEYYFRDAMLHREGTLTEYNYEKNSFYYTPIQSADYSFNLILSDSGGMNMILDDFKVDEGYEDVLNSYGRIYLGQSHNGLIVEQTQTATAIQVIEENESALKMTGSTNTDYIVSTNPWEGNQNYITKANFKVNASGLTSLYLRFDLKQLYNQNAADSGFRVLVNGTVMGEIIYPQSSKQISFQPFEFNLTPYVGGTIYISLQHIGKTTTDIAYLKNIDLNQGSTLSISDSESFKIKVWPNPTNSILNIESTSFIEKLKVSNISGQIIKEINVNDIKATVDMADFSRGVYFVTVTSEGKNKTLKILKL